MANNRFQHKRSIVSGVLPTTSDIAAGELGLNLADRRMFTSNGTAVFELGSNLTNLSVSGNLTVNAIVANGSLGTSGQVLSSNGAGVYWSTVSGGSVNTSAQYTWANVQTYSAGIVINNNIDLNFKTTSGASVGIRQQSDDNFVFYTTNTTGGSRAVFNVFANTNAPNQNSAFRFNGPVDMSSSGIYANNSLGTAGQVLTSSGGSVYWSSVSGTGTVTSVATGSGLTGGPITTTGTVSVLANNGITANTTGLFVTQGTGAVVNATGVHVNASYIATIAANSATGSLTNTFTVGTAAYFVANGNVGVGNTAPGSKLTVAGTIHGQATSGTGDVLIIGNDTKLVDIDVAHTAGIQSASNTAIGGLRFGSGGGTIFGVNNNIGINNTTPDATLTVTGTANVSGNLVIGGSLSSVSVSDSAGDLRTTPVSASAVVRTFASGDSGEIISTTANVTVNGALLSSGFIASVFNNSALSITIISGAGVTMYLAGTASTGNRTLAQRGLTTVTCVAANTFVISGAGLT